MRHVNADAGFSLMECPRLHGWTNTELIKAFNCCVRDHPAFAEEIPDDPTWIMQREST